MRGNFLVERSWVGDSQGTLIMNDPVWQEGYDAYLRDERFNTNPYEIGTDVHRIWLAGWNDAYMDYDADEDFTQWY